MTYRYSWRQSQMQPPFWVITDRGKHIAEVWDESVAKRIVSALEALPEPAKV